MAKGPEGAPGDVADSEPLDLTIIRVLDAPRALVFLMWAEPAHVKRWCCPEGFTVAEGTLDFRAGGRWESRLRGPDGKAHRLAGSYREILAEERIVFTHAWLDEAGEPGPQTLVTVTLEDQGQGTKLTFHQAGFPSPEARDARAEGWHETLDKLELELQGVTPLACVQAGSDREGSPSRRLLGFLSRRS